MGYHFCNGLGDSIDNPSIEVMTDFIERLDPNDEEHGAVWLSDESDNCIQWDINGKLAYSNESGDRHLLHVEKDHVVELWTLLVKTDFESLESETWNEGISPPLTPEEIQCRERKQAEIQLTFDKGFYGQLGRERANIACKASGCKSGAIRQGIYCRSHHFESVKKRPCPF